VAALEALIHSPERREDNEATMIQSDKHPYSLNSIANASQTPSAFANFSAEPILLQYA